MSHIVCVSALERDKVEKRRRSDDDSTEGGREEFVDN